MDFESEEFDEMVRQDFAKYDVDGSGYIEPSEIRTSLLELAQFIKAKQPDADYKLNISFKLFYSKLQLHNLNVNNYLRYFILYKIQNCFILSINV